MASYSGVTANNQGWTIPRSYIAGYSASLASGTVNSTVTNNAQSVTFYWVIAASSQTVTFSLNYGNNQNAQAQAIFNISAPSPANPTVSLPAGGQLYVNTLTGCAGASGGQFLNFGNLSGAAPGCGNPSGSAGIAFVPPTTSSPPGNFFFVQLVENDSVVYSRTGATLTCTGVGGLDGAYPYQNKTAQTVNDAPEAPLPSTFTLTQRSFSASMYLMWQSNTANSIPVPIGYVSWQFSGSASEPQQNSTWGSPTGGGSAGSFTVAAGSAYYPTWNGLNVQANQNCH